MANQHVEHFTPVPDWLAERIDLTAIEKLIYSRIRRFEKHVDEVYPKYDWIAGKCGVSKSCVQRAVKRLEEVGLLSIQRRFGRSHFWHAREQDEPNEFIDDIPTEVNMTAADATTEVTLTTTDVNMTTAPKSDCSRHRSQSDSLLRVSEESILEENPTMSDEVGRRKLAALRNGTEILDAMLDHGGARGMVIGNAGKILVRKWPSAELDVGLVKRLNESRDDVLAVLHEYGGRYGDIDAVVEQPASASEATTE